MSQQRGGRRGAVFCLRLTDAERTDLERMRAAGGGPRAMGPWLVWQALRSRRYYPSSGNTCSSSPARVIPAPPPGGVLPRHAGSTLPGVRDRLILDLCGGSGAWSQPYRAAGYRVELVTLPRDVRTWKPPREPVWGLLAAPPCTEFSLAKNGRPRAIAAALSVVDACVRLAVACRPRWWALENPVGLLGNYLGTPRDVWQPCDFGDPWTKRTALWGDFTIPYRGPFVRPRQSGPPCPICDPARRRLGWCSNPAHRAITPAGFVRAFFVANP